jgi:hypothetical protein
VGEGREHKVVFADYYERDQTDFTAILLKMKSLNPDSLYIDALARQRHGPQADVGARVEEDAFGSVNFFNTKLVSRRALLEAPHVSVVGPVFLDAISRHSSTPTSGSATSCPTLGEPGLTAGWSRWPRARGAGATARPSAPRSPDQCRPKPTKFDAR